jgi:GNAT superfamily N-acetyltransferase
VTSRAAICSSMENHDVSDQSVALTAPDRALLERLLPVARRIFTDTFGRLYDPEDFERFCDGVYRPDGTMSRDFSDPRVLWRVAIVQGEPIGYAKLTPLRAPVSQPRAGAMELQQIYVLSDWHGSGVAARLMEWGLAAARAQGAPDIYLTVFDHNERAKRFYVRYGFEEVGRCTFQLGEHIDDDRIWRARLDG